MQHVQDWIDYFRKMGFDIFLLITGMSGYLVAKKRSKKSIIAHILDMLSGGLCAMFITPLLMDVIKANHSGELALAFGIGMMGHKASDIIITFIKNKFNKSQNE